MAEEPAANQPAPTKKKLPLILGIVAAVALLEAGVFLLVFKMSGNGPTVAKAESSHAIEGPAAAVASQPAAVAEVTVQRNLRVPNEKSGRMWIYDMDITVVVSTNDKERLEGLVKQRAGEIGDTLAGIVRSAPDRMLRETDLRALRYQVMEALREIVGEENLIQRVLIPRFVPIPAN